MLKKSGGGAGAIVSSIDGVCIFTNPGATAYSATKAAIPIVQQLALELDAILSASIRSVLARSKRISAAAPKSGSKDELRQRNIAFNFEFHNEEKRLALVADHFAQKEGFHDGSISQLVRPLREEHKQSSGDHPPQRYRSHVTSRIVEQATLSCSTEYAIARASV